MNINQLPQEQQSFSGFLNQVPFNIKLITFITILVFIINCLFNDIFTKYFLDIPFKVFQEYQIWRLFFTQFIEGIFGLLFMPLLLYVNISDVEKTLGSVLFLLDFFLKSFLTQVIYLILSLILQNQISYSQGLWNVFLVYMSLQCFANPDQLRSLFFFPCLMPSKYIPYVLVLIGFLMNRNFDSIAAIILAYIEAHYFNFMIFRPSQRFIQNLEDSFPFKYVKHRPDFYIQTQNFQVSRQNQSEQPQSQTQVQEFSGKGVQLGSDVNYENIIIDNSEQYQQDYPK